MKFLLVVLILVLSGCSTIDKVQDVFRADNIAKAIVVYCASTLEIDRKFRRTEINNLLNGVAKIEVTCQ